MLTNYSQTISVKQKLTTIIIGVAICACSFIIGNSVISIINQVNHEKQYSFLNQQLSTIRARLEGEINSTLYLTTGLIAYTSAHPDITLNEFNELAEEIILFSRNIKNIGLAPNNVLSYVYPLQGNEAAIGLDYRSNHQQWPAVEHMINVGKTVVAGPVDLVQGGRAFIARSPIYIRDQKLIEQGIKPKYWGLVSIVIEVDKLLNSAGFVSENDETRFALLGRNATGVEGGMIAGDESVLQSNSVSQKVMLPYGHWVITAAPINGWDLPASYTYFLYSVNTIVSILFGALVGMLVYERNRGIAMATHDPLTGLPNRRLLHDRVETSINRAKRDEIYFTLFYVDLNGFKKINDTYGHDAGDHVLLDISHRLFNRIRAEDTVARIGGDEFIILAIGMHQKDEINQFSNKLIRMLNEPVFYSGKILSLSASVGVATYPTDGSTVERLLLKADSDMYLSKDNHYQKENNLVHMESRRRD